jgi:soluble lytic murein transglycosylase-like protein
MRQDLAYVGRLLAELWRRPERRWRRAAVVAPVVVIAMVLSGAVGGALTVASAEGNTTGRADVLLGRAERVAVALRQVDVVYEAEVAPLERVLRNYRDDARLTRRIAVALLREAKAAGVQPELLLAVLLVENPDLRTRAKSIVGAQGLMQVMPLHRGNWRPCAPRLDDIESNVCHGARIFASYLRAEDGNVERALLRYNGCVKGTNTPDCHQYANHVFARAGRARVLAWN